MKHLNQEDGWDTADVEESFFNTELPPALRYHLKEAPRDILDNQHHSLEPDMAMGWKPKLPSCPLPLSYNNTYLDSLAAHLPSDDRFKLAYFGPRYTNSVQINQQYQYFWRYRSRYNTTINAVKEAVKRVGEDGKRMTLNPTRNQIVFDSAFEAGNLDMAIRVKKTEYDLFLRCDTNTRGHTAWFYFKVDNKDQTGQIQFNICNFGKKKNLYAQGMKPYVFVNNEWKQEGCYEVNWAERICRYGFDRKTFQLQYKYFFKEKNRPVYFAYSIPYTFSRLQNLLKEIESKSSRYAKVSRLTQTLGGLDVPLLTITHTLEGNENSDQNASPPEERKKKVALITGRIHPGEPHSSFVVEGFIRFLLSDNPEAHLLRKSFIFYIVPMLNPDGVVAGNFRTSFSGKDLNRQFNQLNKYVFPEITALHDLAFQLKHNFRSAFKFYFDFHAHSSKRGLFCYGPEHTPGNSDFFRSRALAKLIEQKTSIFCYRRSIFTISEHKKNTGRAHMLWKIKIPMTYTFEVSNGLFQTKQNRNNPLTETILTEAGSQLLEGFFRYVQMEMKIPSLNILAKVDTGIKRRSGGSSKEFRKSSSKQKSKTLTTKNIQDLRDLSHTQSSRAHKPKNEVSLKLIMDSEDLNKPSDIENKNEFMKILEQIKKEELQEIVVDEYEGGSDSESDGDDLSDKELLKLHRIIQKRQEGSKNYSKGTLQWRSTQKRDFLRRQCESEEHKQSQTSQELDACKKPITSKYLQPLKNAMLPPRIKKIPYICPQKGVLVPKNFDIEI